MTGRKLLVVTSLTLAAITLGACRSRKIPSPEGPAIPAALRLSANENRIMTAIRFLEDRVKRDPDDFIAYNRLAGYYLQRQRETGSLDYLELAARAAHASLSAMPAEQNVGGVAALAQVANSSHDFVGARDHALKLIQLDGSRGYPYQALGDALLELGDYDGAASAYRSMEKRSRGATTEARMARLAMLTGQTETARRRMSNAVAFAVAEPNQSRELIAWCRWQLGEFDFQAGDYDATERNCNDALEAFPDYYRALASLGKVQGARGDFQAAIEFYTRAVRIYPDPSFVAALGDLFKLTGDEAAAASQYALVEQIGKLSTLGGALYNRQLALFYADHDIKPVEANGDATKEYAVRRDIYGADAVAWTALKAGMLAEAQAAMKEALRLGTRDAKLFYHAAMIERTAGDNDSARKHLKLALDLNSKFDPLQSQIAQKSLDSIARE